MYFAVKQNWHPMAQPNWLETQIVFLDPFVVGISTVSTVPPKFSSSFNRKVNYSKNNESLKDENHQVLKMRPTLLVPSSDVLIPSRINESNSEDVSKAFLNFVHIPENLRVFQ